MKNTHKTRSLNKLINNILNMFDSKNYVCLYKFIFLYKSIVKHNIYT